MLRGHHNGEVYATGSGSWQDIASELGRFEPREVLVGGTAAAAESFLGFLRERLEALIEPMPEESFDPQRAAERVMQHFHVEDFEPAGLTDLPQTVQCLGGCWIIWNRPSRRLGALNHLQVYHQGQYMELDMIARRNLELCETHAHGREKRHAALGARPHPDGDGLAPAPPMAGAAAV